MDTRPERRDGGVDGVFFLQAREVDLLLHPSLVRVKTSLGIKVLEKSKNILIGSEKFCFSPGEYLTLSLVNLLTHTLLSTQRELKQTTVHLSFGR